MSTEPGAAPQDIYQASGSLPPDAPTYVERASDEALYQGVKAGEFCYVLNSRQMGKSSLRVRVMQRLQAEGVACAAIDITQLGSQEVKPDQWYGSLIRLLAKSFGLTKAFNLRTWMRERDYLTPIQRLGEFVEEVLLVEVSQPIAIFVDEIDSILSLNFPTDDFFAFIRACYNQRVDKPQYNRLTIVPIGVATPSTLIQDKSRTPFNIGRAIELKGFQPDEATPLAMGLAEKTENSAAVLTAILAWTGGQPFLTQKICKLAVATPEPITAGEEAAWVDSLVQTQVIDNWESHDEPEHLKTIRNRILHDDRRAGILLGLYQQLLQEGELEIDGSPEQRELRLSGLVTQEIDQLRVFNRIYASIFDVDWVARTLAGLRPYAEALDAWFESDCEDESRLLQGQALQEARDWSVDKSLSNQDYQFLDASQDAENRRQAVAIRRQTVALFVVSGLFGISLLSTAFAFQQRQAALQSAQLANENEAAALASQDEAMGALALAEAAEADAAEQRDIAEDEREIAEEERQDAIAARNAEADQRLISEAALREAELARNAESEQRQIAEQQRQAAVERRQKAEEATETARAAIDSQVEATLETSQRFWQEDLQLPALLQALIAARPMRALGDLQLESLFVSNNAEAIAQEWLRKLLPSIRVRNRFDGHTSEVYSVSFSPDGRTIASASFDGTVKLWDLQGQELRTLRGSTSSILRLVSFSPDGQVIAIASDDGTVKLWDLQGRDIRTLEGHTSGVHSASFSPDGQTVASASFDGTVKLWNLQGQQLQSFSGHGDWVLSVSFSPNGQTIVSGGSDDTVKLWDLQGRELRTLRGHSGLISSVRFSPDGSIIASASFDGTIKIWNLQGQEIQTLRGHTSEVSGISFSPDGQTIASASFDGTIRIWDLKKNQETKQETYQESQILRGHTGWVGWVSFSPDGQTLASPGEDMAVKLWDLKGIDISTSLDQPLEELITLSCTWINDYIATNNSVSPSEKLACESL